MVINHETLFNFTMCIPPQRGDVIFIQKSVILWNIEAELLYRSTHLPVKECQWDYDSVAFKFTQNNAILPFEIDDSLDIAYTLLQLAL